jgi:hypothetical protein
MNRSLTNVLFGGITTPTSADAHKIEGTITKTSVDDTVEALANADSVILVRQSSILLSPLTSLGRRLRHGCRKSSVCYIRNHLNSQIERS